MAVSLYDILTLVYLTRYRFSYYTFWQYTSTGQFGDTSYWNGDIAGLQRYATG